MLFNLLSPSVVLFVYLFIYLFVCLLVCACGWLGGGEIGG